MTGLRGYWKRWDGASTYVKLKNLPLAIRYAAQRAWKGYDFRDLCNFNGMFIWRMPGLLREFKDANVCLWHNLTEEQTDSAIDELIYEFEMADEDNYKSLKLVGTSEEKSEMVKERWEEIAKHREKAMSLFVKYFDELSI